MSFIYNEITSRKNDKIIQASKLCDKKNRDKEGIFFVEGVKLLEEMVLSGLEIERIFFTGSALNNYEKQLSDAAAKEYYLVTDEVFEKITDESSPQGIFACVKKPELRSFSDKDISDGGFIILEDIQNPQNIGAIFRCAFSLGNCKIALSKLCADLYGPKVQRAAMGSINKARFYIYDDIQEFIQKTIDAGNRVFCTHLHSQSKYLGSFEFEKGDSIVIGNEGKGVCQKTVDICTGSLIIPMSQNAESLNAATAAAILIWEMNKQKLLP